MFVCVCNAVTETQVRQCVANGAQTLGDLQFELGVASCCGCCAATAESYLAGNVREVESVDAAVAVLTSVRDTGLPTVRRVPKPAEHAPTRRYPIHQIVARAA
jgi:bacterioferritin-associated ferredoxin